MKIMKLLGLLLAIGAIIMFVLAQTLNVSIGWVLGLGMLFVAAAIVLVVLLLEGEDKGTNIPMMPHL